MNPTDDASDPFGEYRKSCLVCRFAVWDSINVTGYFYEGYCFRYPARSDGERPRIQAWVAGKLVERDLMSCRVPERQEDWCGEFRPRGSVEEVNALEIRLIRRHMARERRYWKTCRAEDAAEKEERRQQAKEARNKRRRAQRQRRKLEEEQARQRKIRAIQLDAEVSARIAWIVRHGSDRLRQEMGKSPHLPINWKRLYLEERLALEWPAWRPLTAQEQAGFRGPVDCPPAWQTELDIARRFAPDAKLAQFYHTEGADSLCLDQHREPICYAIIVLYLDEILLYRSAIKCSLSDMEIDWVKWVDPPFASTVTTSPPHPVTPT